MAGAITLSLGKIRRQGDTAFHKCSEGCFGSITLLLQLSSLSTFSSSQAIAYPIAESGDHGSFLGSDGLVGFGIGRHTFEKDVGVDECVFPAAFTRIYCKGESSTSDGVKKEIPCENSVGLNPVSCSFNEHAIKGNIGWADVSSQHSTRSHKSHNYAYPCIPRHPVCSLAFARCCGSRICTWSSEACHCCDARLEACLR